MTDRVFGYDHDTVGSPTDLSTGERYIWAEADAAIQPGRIVAIDIGAAYTTTAGPMLVIAATNVGTTAYALGIYTGRGGSGAEITPVAAANTGGPKITGRAAADGDLIEIQTYGLAKVDVDTAGGMALGEPMIATTAGKGVEGTTLTVAAGHKFTCLEAATTSTTDGGMYCFIH